MFQSKWACMAALAAAALLALPQPATAEGVVITDHADIWDTSITAHGDENGSWTGRGILTSQGFTPWILDIEGGGEFEEFNYGSHYGMDVYLWGTASQPGGNSEFQVVVVADSDTGEWAVDFIGVLFPIGYEPEGIGKVNIHP